MSDENECGHSDEEHEHLRDLSCLMVNIKKQVVNPRVMLIMEDSGEVHFASTLPPGEAAQFLDHMATRVRRYGGNYVRDHFDRGRAAQWN